MNLAVEELITELQRLPEAKVQAALEFIRFLVWQNRAEMTIQTEEPLLGIAGVLSGEMLTAEEIERGLYSEF